jgi:adenine-specific DNA-methyltransferase
MRDRLELLRRLLAKNGSLWITIDDTEVHYLKVLCDEIFGRDNFVANAVWQKKYTVANDAKWLADNHDHVLIYTLDKESWRPYPLPRTEEMNDRYRNPDGHPKGVWKATPLNAKRSGSVKEQAFSFTFKNGRTWVPPSGTSPRFPAATLRELDLNNEIWFGTDGTAAPSRKTFLSDLKIAAPPSPTVWLHSDAGHNHEARSESKIFNSASPFATPKPERLLHRILSLATVPGDLVLDSFAGSGTTGAVAHKMGRRWIMIELGEHIHSHIIPRMKKVIDGTDPGGVTEAAGWRGGGGFRYFKLAPSLLTLDRFGNHVISEQYNAAMLAEAMCKLMGFTYSPSEDLYWQQGRSTETDFLYTTTQTLSRQQLEALSEEVGPDRSLLICCAAYRAKPIDFPNLTLRKIPMAVLARCEWGKDDYSLNVANLGAAPEELPEAAHADRPPASPAEARKRKAAKVEERGLFDEEADGEEPLRAASLGSIKEQSPMAAPRPRAFKEQSLRSISSNGTKVEVNMLKSIPPKSKPVKVSTLKSIPPKVKPAKVPTLKSIPPKGKPVKAPTLKSISSKGQRASVPTLKSIPQKGKPVKVPTLKSISPKRVQVKPRALKENSRGEVHD